MKMREENGSYLLHCPSKCLLEKKKFAQCKELWQYLAHLESL